MEIIPFDNLRQQKIALTVHNVISYNLPFHISIFSSSCRLTRRATLHNFNLPPTNNVYGKRLLQFAGVKVWNDIPCQIKESKSFAGALKKYFLEKNEQVH